MVLQVHDALLFKMHYDELHLIPVIQKTMCDAYPHKLLPMQSDVGYSNQSWGDLTDEIPIETAARKKLPKRVSKKAAQDSALVV